MRDHLNCWTIIARWHNVDLPQAFGLPEAEVNEMVSRLKASGASIVTVVPPRQRWDTAGSETGRDQ